LDRSKIGSHPGSIWGQLFRTDYTGQSNLWPLVVSLLLIGLVTLTGKLYGDYLGISSIGMLFLLPVIFAAVRTGIYPAIFIALISFVCWDIFFIPPVLLLTASDPRHLITFLVFLLVAYTAGNMTELLRSRAREALQRESQTRALYELARELSAAAEMSGLGQHVVNQTAATLDAEAVLFQPDDTGKLQIAAANRSLLDLASSPNDLLAAQWTFENNQPSGLSTTMFTGARGYHVPVQTEKKILGVLSVKPLHDALEEQQRSLVAALAGLSALAMVRLELAEEAQEIKSLEASERLQAALFNSISHDLKTPLTSILGSVSSLVDEGSLYDVEQKATLLSGIKHSAERMNRFVNNLLDMARLESGYMKLNREWSDLQDIIGVTLRENQDILREHTIRIEMPDQIPLIKLDYALIEQVLTNLLHNAVKYSPLGSEILISVTRQAEVITVTIADQGEGIPVGDQEAIFDKFYRLQSPHNVSGTGLGLSICRGIIEAHEGRIWAVNRAGGGSLFNFSLPLEASTPQS